jgi:hypothetical protein
MLVPGNLYVSHNFYFILFPSEETAHFVFRLPKWPWLFLQPESANHYESKWSTRLQGQKIFLVEKKTPFMVLSVPAENLSQVLVGETIGWIPQSGEFVGASRPQINNARFVECIS